MKIKLNGKDKEITGRMSVSRFLEELKINPEGVVVELNLQVLNKGRYEATNLKEGDSVEIINFVGGG
ncbi:MAG: sulfur carrier protein ThiS [Candidatus Omnitrophica bacterium]|nr:sulfur carrier protein ThiS [Candidatus Omnitrophota bacterium]